MRITLAQLEAFVAVCRLGTVREASRHLNLAQPSVSLRLRDLEENLGVRLFEKSGRGLRLSQDGTGVLEYAERILDEVGRLKGSADTAELSGKVRLGVSESFAVTGLHALLRIIAATHPDLRVELKIEPSPELVRDVVEHELDLAIAINPPDDHRLRIVPLGVQPATWAASPALSLPPLIRPADVLHQTILVNPRPSPNWQQTMLWFGSAGLEPLHISSCNTVPSVVAHLVEAGLGIGILPTKLIEPQIEAGKLVAIDCRPAIEKSYLSAVQISGDRDPAAEAILAGTRKVLEDLRLLEPI